ncbi:MAG TPA: DUF3105 domain-containing protein [Thermomicrobiales bacterium]|nr:DUF3105 domain-containing protein [Thermomicrobiales bacterium]
MARKSQSQSRPARKAAGNIQSSSQPETSTPKLDPLSQRRETRSRGRSAAAEARRRQKRIRNIVLAVVAVLAIGLGSVFAYQRITYVEPGTKAADLGGGHVEQGTTVSDYNTDPPTSGQHYASTAPWGIHTEPVQNELQVHNLEHGGIVIQYNDSLSADEISVLESITNQCDVKLLLAPRPDMEQRIAVTAWTYYEYFDTADRDAIQKFIDAHVDEGPERIASESDRWNDCN